MSNIYNLFKFLEKKRGTETPIEVKLIYAPEELTDEELNVEDHLDLFDTPITSLPDNLQVGGSLNIKNTDIKTLPNNLKVEGSLNLINTKITSLPDNLQVGGWLNLYGTPLGKKYTKEEIKKIIEKKGGYVKRDIYV